MTQPFLVTGLPRSRTAWLSVVSSGYRSFCHHEPSKDMANWREINSIWSGSRYNYAGIADSLLGFHIEEILAAWHPKTLIVERPVEEVEASLARVFPTIPASNYCQLLSDRLNSVPISPLVMRVRFADLDSVDIVWECLRHLMPGAKLDLERIEALMPMNIHVRPDFVLAKAQSAIGHGTGLFGEGVVRSLELVS